MNWTKLSAITEVFGSLAVVVTLIYLAVQVRQNTDAMLSSSRQASLGAELGLMYSLIDHPNAAMGGPLPFEELTAQEQFQRTMLMNVTFRIRENLWLQFQSGTLDAATWESYRGFLIFLLGSERARKSWNDVKRLYNPGFVAEIDRFLDTTPQ